MGRPTDYSEEILEKARDYLENYAQYGDAVPSIAGLADTLGITRTTVYDWSKQEAKAEFSYIVERILGRQERRLTQGGLAGDHNPTIAKLMLSKHGYSDKQEVSGPNEGPIEGKITIELVSARSDS